jgi:hypothetical protein
MLVDRRRTSAKAILRTKVRKASVHETLRMAILVALPELAEPGNVIIVLTVVTRSQRIVLETMAASGKDAVDTPRKTGGKGQAAS